MYFASSRNPELTESIAIWARGGHYTDALGVVQQLKDVRNVAVPADLVSAGLGRRRFERRRYSWPGGRHECGGRGSSAVAERDGGLHCPPEEESGVADRAGLRGRALALPSRPV